MLPGALGVEKTQDAAGAEFTGFRIDATVDVLDADPLRRFDPIDQLHGNRCVVEKDYRADQQFAKALQHLGHALGARRGKSPATLEQERQRHKGNALPHE